jgi:hypothetical protein
VDFALKVLEIDGVQVRLQLWDIAGLHFFGFFLKIKAFLKSLSHLGQERFGNMTRVSWI